MGSTIACVLKNGAVAVIIRVYSTMRFGGRGDSFVAPDIVQELFFMVSRQQLLSMRMGSKVLPQVWVWGASLDNGRANETTSLFYIFLI